jgi:protein-tyrosine-phosphatase
VVGDAPDTLFVCVHNAGRSQMAAGLLKLRAAGRVSFGQLEAILPTR